MLRLPAFLQRGFCKLSHICPSRWKITPSSWHLLKMRFLIPGMCGLKRQYRKQIDLPNTVLRSMDKGVSLSVQCHGLGWHAFSEILTRDTRETPSVLHCFNSCDPCLVEIHRLYFALKQNKNPPVVSSFAVQVDFLHLDLQLVYIPQ